MRTSLLATALVLAATSIAAAQPGPPGMTPSVPPTDDDAPLRAPERPAAAPAAEKSEGTATAIALGATALGYAIAIEGANNHANSQALGWASAALIVIGPSAGHIYAGEGTHALGMSALRAGGVVTFGLGMLSLFVAEENVACANPCTGNPGGTYHSDSHTGGEAAMLIGGGAFIIGTAYDLYDAHRAAQRANEHSRARAFAPTALQGPRGGMSPGLAFSGQW